MGATRIKISNLINSEGEGDNRADHTCTNPKSSPSQFLKEREYSTVECFISRFSRDKYHQSITSANISSDCNDVNETLTSRNYAEGTQVLKQVKI